MVNGELRQRILLRDKYLCQRCFDKQKADLETHHILARRYGGGDSYENLITYCVKCHRIVEPPANMCKSTKTEYAQALTTMAISLKHRNECAEIGGKDDTFDQILGKLLNYWRTGHKK